MQLTVNVVAGIDGPPTGLGNIEVEASVDPNVTTDLPKLTVSPVTKRKQLRNLEFAYPDYETSALVDNLLGGKVFIKGVFYVRYFISAVAPSVCKKCL